MPKPSPALSTSRAASSAPRPELSASRSSGTVPTEFMNHFWMRPLRPPFFQNTSLETKRTMRGATTGMMKLSTLARWLEASRNAPVRGMFSSPVIRGRQ
jgi:hypothetical protein